MDEYTTFTKDLLPETLINYAGMRLRVKNIEPIDEFYVNVNCVDEDTGGEVVIMQRSTARTIVID